MNLEGIPAPDAIKQVSFDLIVSELIADVESRSPKLSAALQNQAEPLRILIEAFAYRETVIRSHANYLAQSRTLAFSTGGDLDHVAADEGVQRLLNESDSSLKQRVIESFDSKSTAGSVNTYKYYAKSASSEVVDVQVINNGHGEVVMYLLFSDTVMNDANLIASNITSVYGYCSAENNRPLSDVLNVFVASFVNYSININLVAFLGSDDEEIIKLCLTNLSAYANLNYKIQGEITIDWIKSCCLVSGVRSVTVLSPVSDIFRTNGVVPKILGVNIQVVNHE